jgi:hypothetical protein
VSGSRWRRIRDARGLALVLVLSLVALLVALMLALAAGIGSSHRAVAVETARAAARRSALRAIDDAVSRLQSLAGPDSRVTATADSDDAVANRRWTGVWAHDAGAPPLSWLVSGNSDVNPLLFVAAQAVPEGALLVGPGSVGEGNDAFEVRAPLVDLDLHDEAVSADSAIAGRYAWWIGDEGIKASLGVPDRSLALTYPPYDSPSMRTIARVQAGREASFLPADDGRAFDPQTNSNSDALTRLVSLRQVNELTPLGSGPLDQFAAAHDHEFTAESLGVLASTRVDAWAGLKRDLSLDPSTLGPAVAAWMRYWDYMEVPGTGAAMPVISDATSMRRRYRLVAPVTPTDASSPMVFSVSPVLTELMLQFSIQRAGPIVQVKARLHVGLWNPYSSALVPETLRLKLSGLPTVLATDLAGGGSQSFNLETEFGGEASPPCEVRLPFTSAGTNDTVSWLPGRWYGWTTATGVNPSGDLHFYDKNMSASGWMTNATIGGTAHLAIACATGTTISFALELDDGTVLASGTTPAFGAFAVADSMAVTQGGWNFGFGFRLRQVDAQSNDRAWLVTPGLDPRATAPTASAYEAFDPAKGLNPAAYFGTPATASGLEHFLLFRSLGGSSNVSVSANNDVPLFELPRQPVLNLAGLAQLQVAGARPFALGNSWAPSLPTGIGANAFFDGAFFSGLTSEVAPPDLAAGEPPPNFHLRAVDTRTSPTQPLSAADIGGAGADSARFFLIAGAFNANATSPRAWQAELSRLRFSDEAWSRADIDNSATPTPTLGTQVAATPGVVNESFADAVLGGPGFAVFRFPQSAQETFAASALADPAYPTRVPFRRGVRGGTATGAVPGFDSTALATLANAIASRTRRHLASAGPFRDLEEFLGPSPEFGGRSLLEDAIAETGLNDEALAPNATVSSPSFTGMSSLTLLQSDLLGFLAPILQVRSDTFVIRAYGEARDGNGSVSARAWCEARVQRLPIPFDSSDAIAKPAGALGRRFRVISFRWLNPDDV